MLLPKETSTSDRHAAPPWPLSLLRRLTFYQDVCDIHYLNKQKAHSCAIYPVAGCLHSHTVHVSHNRPATEVPATRGMCKPSQGPSLSGDSYAYTAI